MNIEEFRNYCLTKKGVTESFPFDNETLVFKVMGKMFALTNTKGDFSINLKCNPEKAVSLREQYPSVKPGFHMNKKHWNSISIDGSVSKKILIEWIDQSYNLIVNGLNKKQREKINSI
jgi:predicted DNA-binding protein (MmcQ/YjbR family)